MIQNQIDDDAFCIFNQLFNQQHFSCGHLVKPADQKTAVLKVDLLQILRKFGQNFRIVQVAAGSHFDKTCIDKRQIMQFGPQ